MKILHVHDYFAPGNSRYGFDMDRLLVGRGHEVRVLAGVGELGPEDGSSTDGVTFHTYPYAHERGGVSKYNYAVARNAERFGQLHREHAFDLVVLNQPLCTAGILRNPASAKVPKVYSFISPWAEEWRIANPGAGFLRRLIHYGSRRRMERKALKAADAVMVESRFIESELKRLHPGIDVSRVHLIPGAVDIERFAPSGTPEENRKKLGLPPDAKILLTVRRLVPRMGLESLVRALPGLPGTCLVLGGDGPERPALERVVDELGLRDRVRFYGYVPDPELPALYRSADLFVLPTRDLEGFGLVMIEAMACGTPAAGTPVGAIPEVLKDLDPRLLFAGRGPEEIGAGIRKLLEDSDLLPSLRSRCREYVSSRFNWHRVVQDVEKIFEGVLGGRR